jgi:hypothetical protein
MSDKTVPLPPFLTRQEPVPLAPRPSADDLIRARRLRQAIFERGVGLALVSSMLDEIAHLRELTEGMRWLLNEHDLHEVERFLRSAREDILRMQRLEAREAAHDLA